MMGLLGGGADSFFDEMPRIAKDDYIPTAQDILRLVPPVLLRSPPDTLTLAWAVRLVQNASPLDWNHRGEVQSPAVHLEGV